jgi:hypothetical protein
MEGGGVALLGLEARAERARQACACLLGIWRIQRPRLGCSCVV